MHTALSFGGACGRPLWLDLQLKIMLIRWKIRDGEHLPASRCKAPAKAHFCLNKISMLAWPWEMEVLSVNLDSGQGKEEKKIQRDLGIFQSSVLLLQKKGSEGP